MKRQENDVDPLAQTDVHPAVPRDYRRRLGHTNAPLLPERGPGSGMSYARVDLPAIPPPTQTGDASQTAIRPILRTAALITLFFAASAILIYHVL